MSGSFETLRSMKSRQFAVYMAVFLPVFVGSVMILDVVGAPTVVVFVGGMAFAEVGERLADRYTDQYVDELEADGRTAT